MTVIAAIDRTTAAFVLTAIVLVGAIGLTFFAVGKSEKDQKLLTLTIGLLFGLSGAGGFGALFVDKAADDAAKNVKKDVQQQVDEVAKQP